MANLETYDFFKNNPVNEFIGAGFEKYRPHSQWIRNINNASLYFIADGSLRFSLKDRHFVAAKNDVVFLKKSDIATISNNDDTYGSLYYIAFNFNEKTELLSETLVQNTEYKHLFKDILDTHLSKAPFSNLKIFHLFLKLLYNLSIDSLRNRKDYITISRIQSAAEYINVNYYKNISIDSLCKISGYSPAHLRRLFFKTYGKSPRDYILGKRIEMAKEMLFEIPEKTVDQIADLIGITSSSYFCKLFKSKTGFSPMEYKLKHTSEKQN